MRIEFKAYGGTGALIARSFVALLALNACDRAVVAEAEHDQCVLYKLDYDEVPALAGSYTDASYLDECVEYYQALAKRKLGFLTPMPLQVDTHKLKTIRDEAYGITANMENNISLRSLFCQGANADAIYELLSSAFTADINSNSTEIERSNKEGCYGDLAVNGFISERIITQQAFMRSGIYDSLGAAIDTKPIIFYAGSTDGGTANTMIDKDVRSLLHYLNENVRVPVDSGRTFQIYGLRTTPYSYFDSSNGTELDKKITASILADKFPMSIGVFKKIRDRNQTAQANDPNIDNFAYYNDGNGKNYWFDGLFVAGSDKLDITGSEAKKDGQFHPTHLVEFALAEQAMDAIAKRLPQVPDGMEHLFGYNDGGDNSAGVTSTLEKFFSKVKVRYAFEYYDKENAVGNTVTVPLEKYIRAFFLTLVSIKGRLLPKFKAYSGKDGKREKKKEKCIWYLLNDDSEVYDEYIDKAAAEMEKFLKEVKFIAMTFANIRDYARFGHKESDFFICDFVEAAFKYVYEKDNMGTQNDIPGGSELAIDNNCGAIKIAPASEFNFEVIENMHEFEFHEGGMFAKADMRAEKDVYPEKFIAGTPDETGFNIANSYIKRTFENFLALLK